MSSSEPYASPVVASAAANPSRLHGLRQALVLACATLLPVLALHWGGWPAALAGWGLAAWVLWRGRQDGRGAVPSTGAEQHGPGSPADGEIHRLAAQVVPVWRRNLEGARGHSERSMGQLLESFAGVSSQLDQALAIADGAPSLELGAYDRLVAQHQPQIEQLTDAARRALAHHAGARQVLDGFADELAAMASLTRDVQNIGRATHLLALNTSVEAARSGQGSGGFMVVADEVRNLAGQSREAGSRLARHVAALQERLAAVQQQAGRDATDDEELRLCTEQAARGLVSALLDRLAEATRATRNLHGVGRQLQGELERVMVGMQSQDRLSQMIGSVTDDMARLDAHLHGARDPLAATPAEWLARLEASYTMDDQRSHHHGGSAVDQASTVEFF